MNIFTCPICGKEWPANYCPDCSRTIDRSRIPHVPPNLATQWAPAPKTTNSVDRERDAASAQRGFVAKPAAIGPAIPARATVVVICLGVLGLVGEVIGRQMHYQQLSARLTAERTQAEQARTDLIAQQDQAAKAQIAAAEADDQSRLQDKNWLSGALATEAHQKEWAARINHNPQMADSVLETNLLAMERLGQDATLAAQNALERVALLASPKGSRVEVVPEGEGYRIRVAFMMSQVSQQEAGAITKHHTTASMRQEVEELSARLLRDLYRYCGSRGINYISVTCNHTLRQTVVPTGATEEERQLLLNRAAPIPARLYRLSLDQTRARSVADWREVSLSAIIHLCRVEYDGLSTLTISQGMPAQESRDAEGDLQY